MENEWNIKGIKRARTGSIFVLVTAFIGFGGWAATASITGSVIAAGSVKVEKNKKSVQHNEGGIVHEILVSDGDTVSVGDVLIRLDATRARNSFNLLQKRHSHVIATIARLRAELQMKKTLSLPQAAIANSIDDDEHFENQQELLEARLRLLKSSRSIIKEQIGRLKQEVIGLKEKVKEQIFQITSLEEEADDLTGLLEKGLTSRTRLLEFQREMANLRGMRAESLASIASAERSIAESIQSQNRLMAEFHERANTELSDHQSKLSDIIEQMESAAHSLALAEIRATASGIVVGLNVHTVGGVIAPGETLLEILPAKQNLMVEAKIEVKDVDLVFKGQPVDIQFVSSKSVRYNER